MSENRSFSLRLRPLRRLLLLLALCGCGLGDSAIVECRCTPETNVNLFPECPSIIEALTTEQGELWVTADLDTLAADEERIVVKGEAVRREGGDSANPFATQIPDCPSGQRLVLREPTRPEFVLFNLRSIFQAQPESRNLDQYMDQLAQDFTFVPDEQDIQLHPEVYVAGSDTLWGREEELSFARAILDPERIGEVNFIRWYESANDESVLSDDQLRQTFIFPYEAEFVERRAEGEESIILAIKGQMEVELITPTVENPVWVVHRWLDRRDPATAKRSWGELRAEFAR